MMPPPPATTLFPYTTLFRSQLRDPEASRRVVHALDVLLGPEEPDRPVLAAERLESVEDGLGVVEDGGRGVEGDRGVRLDPRVVPALLLLELGEEHVVGEDGAEAELVILGPRLPRGRAADPDGLAHRHSSNPGSRHPCWPGFSLRGPSV